MLRVLFTIVLPLVLPTALYLAWVALARVPPQHGASWAALPWLWLAGAGIVLLAVVLVVTVGFGTSQHGVYVAPRYENGRVVPGHFDPGKPQ